MEYKYRVGVLSIVLGILVSVSMSGVALAAESNGQQFVRVAIASIGPVPISIGAGWSSTTAVPPAFFWYSTFPDYADDGPFTFTSTGPASVYITDDFLKGDQFRIWDGATLLGDTSSVPAVTGSEIGPAAAYLDPTYSHGCFDVGAGQHSIQISAIQNPWSSGRGYIKVESGPCESTKIPEFPIMALPIGSALAIMFLVSRKKHN